MPQFHIIDLLLSKLTWRLAISQQSFFYLVLSCPLYGGDSIDLDKTLTASIVSLALKGRHKVNFPLRYILFIEGQNLSLKYCVLFQNNLETKTRRLQTDQNCSSPKRCTESFFFQLTVYVPQHSPTCEMSVTEKTIYRRIQTYGYTPHE